MKYAWILLLLLVSCAGEENWRDYLPADLYQLSYSENIDVREYEGFPAVSLFDQDVVEFLFSKPSDELGSDFETNFFVRVYPKIDSFPSFLNASPIDNYEGFAFKVINEDLSASILGQALWIAQREILERIIDNENYGEVFALSRPLRNGDYIWRERVVGGLVAAPDPYYQLSPVDSSLYSYPCEKANADNSLQSLLTLIPSDTRDVLIIPDKAGSPFAQFYLAGEWILIAPRNQLSRRDEVTDVEEYQSFVIENHGDQQFLTGINEDWTLKTSHPTDAKNYLDRLMSGSSLYGRPDIFSRIVDHPDAQFLRTLNYKSALFQLRNQNDRPDWWIGEFERDKIAWTILGEVSRTNTESRNIELSFDTRIDRWLDASSWPNVGIQLAGDVQGNLNMHYTSDRSPALDLVEYHPDTALAPPLDILSEKAWPTTRGWQKSNGDRLDAPMKVVPTYVYLPVYDEAIILLATRAGRLLAIRPDGSFWQTAQGRSPNREGSPLTQSPVHISGPDYDRIVTIDEAGQLIFSDLEGNIIKLNDSLFQAEILPLTQDSFLAVRQLDSILLFDKKTGVPLVIQTPQIGFGELAIIPDESGLAHDLLTAQDRSIKRIAGDGKIRFLVQLPFEPTELILLDQDHWLAYHQGTRRWELYNRENRLLTNQRSDLPPKLIDKKLLCVEGERIIIFDLSTLD